MYQIGPIEGKSNYSRICKNFFMLPKSPPILIKYDNYFCGRNSMAE